MNLYVRMFERLYDNSNKSTPNMVIGSVIFACIFLTVFLFIYLVSIFLFIKIVSKSTIITTMPLYMVFMGLIFIGHLIYFFSHKRYGIIIKSVQELPKKNRVKYGIITVLYGVGSILSFFLAQGIGVLITGEY